MEKTNVLNAVAKVGNKGKDILNGVFGKQIAYAKVKSPQILMIGGGILFGVTVFTAVKATLDLDEVLDEFEEKKDKVKHSGDITEKQYKHDMATLYLYLGAKVIKLYLPTAICATGSIACFCGSHRILTARNAMAVGAYRMLDEHHKAYRSRVREDYGEDVDYIYENGLREGEVKEYDGEKGDDFEPRRDVSALNTNLYGRYFDEGNRNYSKVPDYNQEFLFGVQDRMNRRLKLNGHVFLNEVYDALGFKRTSAGAIVGWVKDSETGDNFIDFGLMTPDAQHIAFKNSEENSVYLDFNVQGVIYDLI